MKKNSTFLLFNFIILSIVGQTYEEIIANKTCECISQINNSTNVNTSFKRCILQSKFEAERNDSLTNPNNSVEGMREAFQLVTELVTKNCIALQTKKSEYKKTLFYKKSTVKEATFNFNKGNEFLVAEEYLSAIKAYKKATTLDSEFVLAYDQLGATYTKQKKFSKAIKTYKKSLRLFPEGETSLQNIAEIYAITDDNKHAATYFTTLLAFYPENPLAHYGFAKIAQKNELNESALKHSLLALNYFNQTDATEMK